MHDHDAGSTNDVPSVDELLEVDREFRRQTPAVFDTRRGARGYA